MSTSGRSPIGSMGPFSGRHPGAPLSPRSTSSPDTTIPITNSRSINLAETQNREESYIDIVTYVQPSTKIRLFLDGQYGSYIFTEPASSVRDTRSYGIFGGLNFVPREGEVGPIEPPQGSISLGYKRFDILDAAYMDGSGFVGAVNVSVGIFKKTMARAFFSRDFDFSVYSDATFYLSTAIGRRDQPSAVEKDDVRIRRVFRSERLSRWTRPQGSRSAQDFEYINHAFNLNVRLARHLGIMFQVTLDRRTLGESECNRKPELLWLQPCLWRCLRLDLGAGERSFPIGRRPRGWILRLNIYIMR